MKEATIPQAVSQRFFPNFRSFGLALRLVFLAEAVAVILTLSRNAAPTDQAWQDFMLLSALGLCISLISMALLALVSGWLGRLSLMTGTIVAAVLFFGTIVGSVEGLIFFLYDGGYIPQRWPPWHDSMLVRSLLVGGIIGVLVLRYLVLGQRAQVDARLEQEARMQALQSRIRPHFLFNSMNSIASLTRSDPARAEAALQDLADLFRVLLADARKLVPISAEREISRQYLEIEKLRLGDRLNVAWTTNNIPRNALIPALTLQPLLENAIYHGIEPRFGGGTLKIELWTESDSLNIMISNPLPEVRKHAHGRGNKIAMDNIRQRLITHFGAKHAAMQSFEEGNQYYVKLKMPVVRS